MIGQGSRFGGSPFLDRSTATRPWTAGEGEQIGDHAAKSPQQLLSEALNVLFTKYKVPAVREY